MTYHHVRFGSNTDSGSGVIVSLTCHIIFQGDLIKQSCVFKGELAEEKKIQMLSLQSGITVYL